MSSTPSPSSSTKASSMPSPSASIPPDSIRSVMPSPSESISFASGISSPSVSAGADGAACQLSSIPSPSASTKSSSTPSLFTSRPPPKDSTISMTPSLSLSKSRKSERSSASVLRGKPPASDARPALSTTSTVRLTRPTVSTTPSRLLSS